MPVSIRAGRALVLSTAICFALLILAVTTACGPSVDYKQALEVTDLSGGWYDFGIVDGKNKLVPSVSFRVRKKADAPIRSLSINVHFKKTSVENPQSRDAEEEFAEVFLQGIEFSEGNQTRLLTFRPDTGVTGDPPQTRAAPRFPRAPPHGECRPHGRSPDRRRGARSPGPRARPRAPG